MTAAPIGVAMSGGVDSTASALLLSRDRDVTGFLMDIGQPGFTEQQERVRAIGAAIGIEIRTVDLKQQFERLVLEYCCSTYFAGRTPNPCMVCNREIKFGLLLDHVLDNRAAALATGHYARIDRSNDETALLKGVDPKKDQSYFLARLTPAQLGRIRFPLGSMHKEEVYEFVRSRGLGDFRGQESQDVCFLAETTLAAFLAARSRDSRQGGPVETRDGRVIGRHKGLFNYTVGQRRGLGLPDATPWYVHSLDPSRNRLVVCKESELYTNVATARSVNWLTKDIPGRKETCSAKIRSTHRGSAARLQAWDADSFTLSFDEPQKAVTPGQFVVVYRRDRVIGSGEIVGSNTDKR